VNLFVVSTRTNEDGLLIITYECCCKTCETNNKFDFKQSIDAVTLTQDRVIAILQNIYSELVEAPHEQRMIRFIKDSQERLLTITR
jgi:hypothetical protein